ncbi:class I SAM-dependent methyltransferase [Geomicrobium sp. JSM 1781026]|uniref:class I SAM-dependent methyltransferase n=1 Tax=Geomicrobium sp. JSM 1781026 TaxID=3344580 RepID=UPI0035C16F27
MITTSRKPTQEMVARAEQIAADFELPYHRRNKQTITEFHAHHPHVYMVGKAGKDVVYTKRKEPFFFHPSMATLRIQRLQNGEADPLVRASRLVPGDSFLDVTLGLGSDSIVASFYAGPNGKVIGVEKQPMIASVVQEGLKNWTDDQHPALVEAMRRVQVVCVDQRQYLQKQADNSFDVIYMDPMFKQSVQQSVHLQPLKEIACYDGLSNETVQEALRVAKKAVVLKAESQSSLFDEFGFQRLDRRRGTVTYGTIDL